jgi:hypothetical protein
MHLACHRVCGHLELGKDLLLDRWRYPLLPNPLEQVPGRAQ